MFLQTRVLIINHKGDYSIYKWILTRTLEALLNLWRSLISCELSLLRDFSLLSSFLICTEGLHLGCNRTWYSPGRRHWKQNGHSTVCGSAGPKKKTHNIQHSSCASRPSLKLENGTVHYTQPLNMIYLFTRLFGFSFLSLCRSDWESVFICDSTQGMFGWSSQRKVLHEWAELIMMSTEGLYKGC